MATPWSMEVRSLLRLLADREWHDYKEVIDKLAATVPPGKALRRYEEKAESRRQRNGSMPVTEVSEDEKILYGQRLLANVAFQSLKRRNLEIDETLDGRRVRLKADAEIPGLEPPGGTPEVPQEVSEPQSPPPLAQNATAGEMALFDETQVRELFRAEIDEATQKWAQVLQSAVSAVMERSLATQQRGLEQFLTALVIDLEHTILTNCCGRRVGHPLPEGTLFDRFGPSSSA